MRNDRQRLVEEIFVEAASAPPDARAAILDQRCRSDQALRDEIMSLLSVHEEQTGVLDVPQPLTMGVMKQISGLLRTDDAQLPADGRIGAYHVLRVIGSGGMGVVYLAEQERPRRTVALKVIRRGVATPSLLRRFEHEAEVLGRLHHPGIAQIYEAGVADYGFGPQPYIAMEYVDGRQLLEYAEVNRLGTRERLALVMRICDAVQHAHQRGVIHRDLKPANILVQAEDTTLQAVTKAETRSLAMFAGVGQPKVLDFGVARIADGRPQATTMRTSVGQLIGTLAYMSPEQFGADTREIDTRTDVYSLGVVMFQLLTGKLPFDVANRALPEAVRMIKDEEPTRLSTVNKTFRGDLDTIVYKSLEKDRNRRYQSAAELGADIQRFLLDEPIAAKRDSSMYLLSKKLRRYRGVMIAASIALVALVALAVKSFMSAWEYKAIAAAEKLATDSERIAREQASSLNARLREELAASNIERGRLEAATGNVLLAEDVLWPVYLGSEGSRQAKWALWEMYSRFPCVRSTPLGGEVIASAFSPDGSQVVVVMRDQSVRVHSVEDGKRVRTIQGLPRGITQVSYAPDGRRLLFGSGSGLATIVELDSDPPRLTPLSDKPVHAGAVTASCWSPNGRYFATGGRDKFVRVWNASTLELLSEQSHGAELKAIAFSPDSMQVATGGFELGGNTPIKLWQVPTGVLADEFDAQSMGVTALRFSPDDAQLLVGFSTRLLGVIDIESHDMRVPSTRFNWAVNCIDVSRNGARLLACGGASPMVCLLPSGDELMQLAQHESYVCSGKILSGAGAATLSYDGTLKRWDARKARGMLGVGGFGSWCFGTAYSPDGKVLAAASGDGTIVLADPESRKRIHTVSTGPNVRTRPVLFFENGAKLLAGSDDGLVRIIDVTAGQVLDTISTMPARMEIFALALHPDGHTLAASCADRSVRIWDLRDKKLVHTITGLYDRSEGAVFTHDGERLIVSGAPSGVNVYRSRDWSLDQNLTGSGQAWCVAISPDGTRLAASTWENNIDLWEVGTWKRLPSLAGHRGLSSTVAFSPDGALLASGGDDATVRIWDMQTLRCLATIETAHGESTGLSFHPSGRYLTTGCQSQMVVTWDLEKNLDCIDGNLAFQLQRVESLKQKSR
ncbi:MAG: protein kinase [Phycisphaerales bacterium]